MWAEAEVESNWHYRWAVYLIYFGSQDANPTARLQKQMQLVWAAFATDATDSSKPRLAAAVDGALWPRPIRPTHMKPSPARRRTTDCTVFPVKTSSAAASDRKPPSSQSQGDTRTGGVAGLSIKHHRCAMERHGHASRDEEWRTPGAGYSVSDNGDNDRSNGAHGWMLHDVIQTRD